MHFNLNYGSFAEALQHKDGIAVLAVLYHVSGYFKHGVINCLDLFIFREFLWLLKFIKRNIMLKL